MVIQSVYNYENNTLFSGTSKDDYLYNEGNSVTIDSGKGNDEIDSWGSNVSINSGTGNDTIEIAGEENRNTVTINAGDGDDCVLNGNAHFRRVGGANVKIDGGKGNDEIINEGGANSSLNGGIGNDLIENNSLVLINLTRYASGYVPTSAQISKPDNSTLIGGDGNDSISNNGANVTISGGAGADTIVNGSRYEVYPASKVKIDGGEGNDSIFNGGYYVDKNHYYGGDSLTIDGGEGADTVYNWHGNNSTIIGGKGNDSILNEHGDNVSINGGDGDDTVSNWNGDNSTIIGGTGNDSIYNSGTKNSINGGDGDDTVSNWNGDNSTIIGGKGNDSILNEHSDNVSIDAGTGNDSIVSSANNDTLDGGAGNDLISLASPSHLIQYASGDGFDTIYGFNESDTLTITGGSYSTATSGNDVIVTVGKGKILLKGANGKNLNINKTGSTKLITLTDNDDYFSNNLAGIKISGKDGNDTIINDYFWNSEKQDAEYWDKVTIDGGAGNDSILSEGGNKFSINGGDGDDTIKNVEGNNGKIYGGAGNDSIYNEYGKNLTVYGGEGNDYIAGGKYVDAGDGDDTISGGKTIYGGNGNDYIYSGTQSVTINAGDGNDSIHLSSYNYNSLILYRAGDGDDIIFGFNSSSTLSITGGYSSAKSGNDVIVSVDDEKITLVGAASLSAVKIVNEANPLLVVGTKGNDSMDNKSSGATVKALVGDDFIDNCGAKVSLFGGAGNDTITNKTSYTRTETRQVTRTKQVKEYEYEEVEVPETILASKRLEQLNASIKSTEAAISEAERKRQNAEDDNDYVMEMYYAGNKSNYESVLQDYQDNYNEIWKKILSVGDYTFYTGGTTIEPVQTGWHWVYKKVTEYVPEDVTYQTNNKGTTIDGGAGDDYVINEAADFIYSYTVGDGNDTIAGFNTASKLSISGGSYTASASGNDIVLKVGSGSITLKDTKGKVLNINGTKTFKPAWTLKKTTATYGSAVETLITVKGVKSLDGLSLKNKVVTISAAALNKSKVTVSSGYTLKLGKDVTKPATSKAWSLNKSTATYKQTTTAGYTLADNVINYSAKAVETLATVKGVKSLDGLTLKNKVVTVSAASLNKSKVTISDGYTLKLGKDVTKSSTSKAWSLSKSTASYNQTTTAGYTLANNAINYSAKAVETLATVKGVKSLDGIKVSGKKITLKNSALKSKVTIGGGYEFDFAKDYTQSTISGSAGNDSITTRGKKISVNSGGGNDTIKFLGSATTVAGGKGNDSLWGSSYADSFIYAAGDGKDVIYGFDDKDTLTLDGLDFTTSYSKKNQAVTFKVDNGTITLKDFSATTFHVNGSAYKIKGTNLVGK